MKRMMMISIAMMAGSACAMGGGSPRLAAPGRAAPPETAMAGEAARPGLGTEWGERRSSSVRFVSFERCSGAPSASIAIHYDDEAGIAAMIDHDLRAGERVRGLTLDPGGQVSIALLDDGGDALPGVEVGGRTYVVGEAGRRYEIAVANDGPSRWEIVASVDGLDVVDGREASGAKRGYILEPYSELRIDGFRTSVDDVAAFRFGRVDESYAARTGSARNVGVIGIALFCEGRATPVVRPERDDEVRRRQTADPFPGGWSAPPPR